MNQLTDHGSAKILTRKEAEQAGIIDSGGIVLGHWFNGQRDGFDMVDPVCYDGDQHLVTLAANRTGKGTSAIVPNLMTYEGGVIVTDPKGENAIITADARRRMGQNVQILDPWGIALDRLRHECGFDGSDKDKPPFEAAGFNPLDILDPDGNDFDDDATLIGDTIIVAEGGEYSHWSTEGKDCIATLIKHVATDPQEEGQRHLGRVRDLLNLSGDDFDSLIDTMMKSAHPSVKAGANRLDQKSEKERQAVISTASANTHFLDSKGIRESLTKSTFDFADLKSDDNPLTVYLVLPADRLDTHGRWLRLLVSMALTAVTRTKGKPKTSALFLLDEAAALNRLSALEKSYGLAAGFGLRIWTIFQDLSQLKDLYKNRWQTFIANAGVVQVFGTGDPETARYISDFMGQQTLEKISQTTADKRAGTHSLFESAKPRYRSMHDQQFGRALMTHDEIMRMDDQTQILLIAKLDPIICAKIPYYWNDTFFVRDENGQWVWDGEAWETLYTQHPDQPTASAEDYRTWASGHAARERAKLNAAPEQPKERGAVFPFFKLKDFAIAGVVALIATYPVYQFWYVPLVFSKMGRYPRSSDLVFDLASHAVPIFLVALVISIIGRGVLWVRKNGLSG